MSKALLIYAEGSEDMEITAAADILNRGGVKVNRAALDGSNGNVVTLAHGTKVVCDSPLAECADDFDVIIIPGGLAGSEHCRDSKVLIEKLKAQKAGGRYIAAICAAPGFVLQTHGFLAGGVHATCYPGCNDKGIEGLQSDGVVFDEKAKIITGKGPGYAMEFALKIVEVLQGKSVRDKVAQGMLLN